MSKFEKGQVIYLKSDKNIKGAITDINKDQSETRYKVFTPNGFQTYYESQIASEDQTTDEFEVVDDSRFHAGITASLIRNPTISSLYSINSAKIDFIPHQFRPVLKYQNR